MPYKYNPLSGFFDYFIVGEGVAFSEITGAAADNGSLLMALDLKANLSSPTFTDVPLAPTAALGTNTDQLATTAFIQAELAALAALIVTTYATQIASQAAYTLDALSVDKNFSIVNNLAAVALTFSNLAVGKKIKIKYSKTTALPCTLTFAASTAIYDENGALEAGVTSILSSATITGIYKIEAENVDGLICVNIKKWVA